MPIPRMSKIWMDGELVDADDARVHVLTPSLHNGVAVFESLRAYATDRGPAIFQHRAHVERLYASAGIMGLEIPYRPDELMEAARQLCRLNGQEAYHIRPLVFLGAGEMGLDPSDSPVRVAVAVWPAGPPDAGRGGITVGISSWQRASANAIPTAAKVAGAYVASALATAEANRIGVDGCIMLNEHGRVAGGAAEHVFIVSDGVLITPPTSEGVLRGITRDAVLDLARDRDIPTQQAPLLRHDLYDADEAFFTSAPGGLVPIRSVDRRAVAAPGPITKQVQAVFGGVVRGREPKYDHMLDYVTQH